MHPRTGPSPRRALLTRRAVLGATGASALLALAGCNPFSTGGKTITVTTEAPPPTAPLLSLVFKTRLHVAHLISAVAEDKRDRALLTMLLGDRQAHLRALQAEYARSVGETTAVTTPVPTTGDTSLKNKDPDAIIAVIRGDAGQAQGTFTDAMSTAPPYQAQMFASIAACMATHRAVLA